MVAENQNAERADIDSTHRHNDVPEPGLPSIEVVYLMAADANNDSPRIVPMRLARHRRSIRHEIERRSVIGADRKRVRELLALACFAVLG
ncbi:MAG: hypothetical protein K8R60_07495 [Burkholderiales bacterium]|nr:hypothetical protein [Burkholderiales bacterium]